MSVDRSREQLASAEELADKTLTELGITAESQQTVHAANARALMGRLDDMQGSLEKICGHLADATNAIRQIHGGNERIGSLLQRSVPAVEAAGMLAAVAGSSSQVNAIQEEHIEPTDLAAKQQMSSLGKIARTAATMDKAPNQARPTQLFNAARGIINALRHIL